MNYTISSNGNSSGNVNVEISLLNVSLEEAVSVIAAINERKLNTLSDVDKRVC